MDSIFSDSKEGGLGLEEEEEEEEAEISVGWSVDSLLKGEYAEVLGYTIQTIQSIEQTAALLLQQL